MLTTNYVLDILFLQTDRLPSSRGLGHIPFTDATGVQIPLGVPFQEALSLFFNAKILNLPNICLCYNQFGKEEDLFYEN